MSRTSRQFQVAVFCLAATFCWPANSVIGAEYQPTELLTSYERSLGQYAKMEFSFNEKQYYSGPFMNLPANSLIEEKTYRVWRDGRKEKLILSRWLLTPDRNGKPSESREDGEIVVPEKGLLSHSSIPGKKEFTGLSAYIGDLPEEQRRLVGAGTYAFPINGFLNWNGFVLVPELLRQSALTARKDVIGGKEVGVLEGKGKWGYHELWLDPNQGFLPLRCVQRKRGQDWVNRNRPVSSLSESDGVGFVQIEQIFEATRIETISSTPFITAFTLTETNSLTNGNTITKRFVVTFSDVALNPNWNRDVFTLSAQMANGTRVYVQDDLNILYEWQDGTLVKSLNQDSIESLHGHVFSRGRWLGRGLFALGCIAVAGLGGLFWYRRWQRRAMA